MGSSTTAVNHIWVLMGLGLAGILLITKKFKKTIKHDYGAFISLLQILPPPPPPPPKAPNPLTALTFSVSDMFDIEGYVTGFGHPDWARTHEAASRTAPVVSALVEGGATCVGKTIIDELAYSVSGENKHYGTPTNPGAHDRSPGGSCSGAAVAVAANLVDFAVGMDAIGGVRLPAGFCGVIGFRASHRAVSSSGIIPVSPSLDAIGCFAKDPSVLRRAVHAMLQLQFASQRNPRQMIVADDCFDLFNARDRIAQPVIRSVEKLFGRQVLRRENLGAYLRSKVPTLFTLSDQKMNSEMKTPILRLLGDVMQFLHRYEFLEKHGDWLSSVNPDLDTSIRMQRQSLEIDESEFPKIHAIRTEMRLALSSFLKDDGVLVIPTYVDPPPKVGGKEMSSEDYLNNLFGLLSIASLSGCCQVTVPLGYHEKCPVSVSFIARQGGDRFLLDVVQTMYASLQQQCDLLTNSRSTPSVVARETNAEIAKEMGNQAYKAKQWQKALGFYTEAIKLSESNPTYYSNRAAVYLELGSFVQAEADATKAIELDKKNVKAYLRRGTAREMLGYYREAIEDFRYALVLEPTNKRAAMTIERLKNLF